MAYTYEKDYSGRLHILRKRAEYKRVGFDLEIEDVKQLWESQNCWYCGDKLIKGKTRKEIDRLVPSRGYTKGNCVMACRVCNTIKGSMVKGDDKIRKILSVIHRIEEA
jgi:5-methylcytosine-specific restriction endonuclease McrA